MRTITVFVALLICIRTSAQTEISYSGLSGTNCIFTSNTSVAATNANNGEIIHRLTVGQVDNDATNHAVSFQSNNNSGTAGSEYRIEYNFKQNYTYKIVVSAFSIHSTNTSDPYLRIRALNTTSTTSSCSGYQIIDGSLTGGTVDYRTITTSPNNFTFNFPSVTANTSYLTIANIPSANVVQTIEITKITITETAPPPPTAVFTLSPSNLNVPCGSTTAQTFTITNVNNTSGVTSYQWNLGANNGWLYNGSAAPSTITISDPNTKTLTLTPASCTSVLSNVSASAFVGTNSYNTNTATVNITAPAATISGPNELCVGTNSTYTISGIPCNASVTWSALKPGVVDMNSVSGSIDPANGAQTVVTALSSENVILRATVTTSCGTYEYSKGIAVLGPPADFAISSDVHCQIGRIVYPSYFSVYPTSAGATYHWSFSKDGGPITNLPYTTSSISHKFGQGSYLLMCSASNGCGLNNGADEFFTVIVCNNIGGSESLSVAPNPASSDLTVTSDSSIQKIALIDKTGQVALQQEFKSKPTRVSLYVGNLKKDIYTLRVYDGKKWESIQVIINY